MKTIVNVYLTFTGNCREAMSFYQSIFGGKLEIHPFSEMPENPEMPLPPEAKELLMHAGLAISDETRIMASDALEGMGPPITVGNNFSISVHPASRSETQRIFKALAADGGRINMPLEDAFWGSYFGMCTDKFGINWMLNFDTQG